MPNRSFAAGNQFRYGFNGKENDNDVKGTGNQQDYGMRIYDTRIGKFLSVDPLTKGYAFFSPYQFSGNTPVMAIDLDGEKPKVVITNQVTGYTKINVYGAGNVTEVVVATYKAIVQYTDTKGQVTEIGSFNITRDGWYDMGTDKDGNAILYNRSSDPSNDKKIFIETRYREKYGKRTPAFGLSPIRSDIPAEFNRTMFRDGKKAEPLDPEVARTNNTAYGAQIHVGGYYEHPDDEVSLGGTYGCYGIVDPSQVFKSEADSKTNHSPETTILSNEEMKRFGSAVNAASQEQKKDMGKIEKTEVEIQKRDFEKCKLLKKLN